MAKNAETAAEWDDEYRRGRWAFLGALTESGRYGILTGWLAETGTAASVLDIGCGEGVLLRHIEPLNPRRYVGVDLSAAAFENTTIAADRGRFEAADLHEFVPRAGERFSAVVFNEVLHFCDDPGAQLSRYAAFLEPGGVIAVSMYAPDRPQSGANRIIERLWAATDGDDWQVLDDLSLTSRAKNVTWKLRLVRPAEG